MKVFDLPCFGNCLATSITHQLGCDLNSANDLRNQVVRHLKMQKQQYFTYILSSCYKTYRHEIIESLSSIELVNRYLRDLKHRRVLCGSECLTAICNLKKLKINVYSFKHPQKIIYDPWVGGYEKEINLLYYGRHYFSIIL